MAIAAATVLAIIITTPIAWLSWRYIEKPFILLRNRLDRNRQRAAPVDRAAVTLAE